MSTPYNPADLRTLIQNTLTPLGLYSPNAEELLMATCAQESLLGAFHQQVNGPANGIFQMEPGDHDDIWHNYLAYHLGLAGDIKQYGSTPADLVTSDEYATAMCRVHYARAPRALPSPTDLNGLWMYYKVNYNSIHGAATMAQFYHNYHRLVTDGKAS